VNVCRYVFSMLGQERAVDTRQRLSENCWVLSCMTWLTTWERC